MNHRIVHNYVTAAEEAGELIQALMKMVRFPDYDDTEKFENIRREWNDLSAMMFTLGFTTDEDEMSRKIEKVDYYYDKMYKNNENNA
jgi:hypothetical protein